MKVKRNTITCNCPAYKFPHRQGGGKCVMPDYCIQIEIDDSICTYECIYFDNKTCPRIDWDHKYDPREEALTVQERNSDFRSW